MSSFSTESFSFIDFKDMDESISKQVWECRNLPEVRKWMVNKAPIPYDSHLRFVESLHQNPKALYFCVLHDGVFIGSVNIHTGVNGSAERGIYIHPDYWGNKFAKRICNEFYPYIIKNLGIKEVTTKVLKQNIGSNALEHSLDAVKVDEDDEFFYYIYNPMNDQDYINL